MNQPAAKFFFTYLRILSGLFFSCQLVKLPIRGLYYKGENLGCPLISFAVIKGNLLIYTSIC